LSTVPTLKPAWPLAASALWIALICALYGVTIRMSSGPTGRSALPASRHVRPVSCPVSRATSRASSGEAFVFP
jgi:hypothetical protein